MLTRKTADAYRYSPHRNVSTRTKTDASSSRSGSRTHPGSEAASRLHVINMRLQKLVHAPLLHIISNYHREHVILLLDRLYSHEVAVEACRVSSACAGVCLNLLKPLTLTIKHIRP
jgi:hypothetical protein